ncbi:MAG TPA: single-stranded-DNA-specific exonuclease RecJ [Pontiella sp.]
MNSTRWKIRAADQRAVEHMAVETGVPRPIARALVLRGFNTPAQAELFMNPRLTDLSDPFLLPDMRKAVDRIWSAIDAGETLAVFGDYDVDGITSAALLSRVLTGLGADVRTFIPSRLDEGYGLSMDAMERCLDEYSPAVLVSVDCGVNSVESVRYAQQRGVDVIVTDHHEPAAQTAPAFALINPKLGREVELDYLSGVGVVFKTAHALIKDGRDAGRQSAGRLDLRDYLDLAALGTVADIVPLIGENRILVRHGLSRMDRTGWVGLQALKAVAGLRGESDTFRLGFQLAPRINAAGRIGQPEMALRLLTTDDRAEARQIAEQLDETNIERRRIEQEITDQAFAEIETFYNPTAHFGLVVAGAGWHPGVVGIVASRVSKHYNRPAIVMGIEEDGCARGSCRSIAEFDILIGLEAGRAHLDTFGGHKMAAGLVVKPGQLEPFKETFNTAAAAVLGEMDLSPVQQVDAVVEPGEIGWEFWEQFRQLQPFGQDNPEPVWLMQQVRVSGSPRVVGKDHLKLSFKAGDRTFDAIAFNYPLDELPAGELDIAFTLKENKWDGNQSLQLHVKNIRSANPLDRTESGL